MTPVGRPVRVTSISFANGPQLAEITSVVRTEAARGTDLVVLPETWLGLGEGTAESVDGPAVTAMSALAREFGTWIVCPIDRLAGDRRFNSSVVIDRNGQVAGIYDKLYPYWAELDLEPPVTIGDAPLVIDTDFGRIGVTICFDVNFPEIWQQMADQGVELVLWPSAYSGGHALQAYAILHHYAIVSATQSGDCQVYDITGNLLLDETASGIAVSRITLDLDRGIYHHNFNLARRDQLLQDHGDVIEQEAFFSRQHWFVLRATAPGVSARDLAQDYGLEELREYKRRSRHQIDDLRMTRNKASLSSAARN